MDTPIWQALSVLKKIKQLGCEQIVICPGGRNAPFVDVLSKSNEFNVTTLFEERAAGFFACGRIKQTKKPVAVITTSGTAVAEVLPAVIEAYYQGLPLIVISADRPKSYRGSGAPQAIIQKSLFGEYCEYNYDLESSSIDSNFSMINNLTLKNKPIHINICFDEPLLNGQKSNYESFNIKTVNDSVKNKNKINLNNNLNSELANFKKPLVILGQIDQQNVAMVSQVLSQLNCLIYAESHSGLRGVESLSKSLITTGAQTVGKIFTYNQCDSIIRIGGIPTLRFWRDLENLQVPVVSFSENKFSGLARVQQSAMGLKQITVLLKYNFEAPTTIKSVERSYLSQVNKLLAKYPNSEQNFISKLSEKINSDGHLFLANSLPIREWDSFSMAKSDLSVSTLRGANGIDGNLAYFLGLAQKNKTNYCVLGDLTAMYDMSSGFIYKKYFKNYKIKIIVINNGGGKIFTPLFNNKAFENNHDIEFSGMAKMFDLNYQRVQDCNKISFSDENEIIEVVPDNQQTLNFNENLKLLKLDL